MRAPSDFAKSNRVGGRKHVRLLGVKRTWRLHCEMSASDPKRTSEEILVGLRPNVLPWHDPYSQFYKLDMRYASGRLRSVPPLKGENNASCIAMMVILSFAATSEHVAPQEQLSKKLLLPQNFFYDFGQWRDGECDTDFRADKPNGYQRFKECGFS